MSGGLLRPGKAYQVEVPARKQSESTEWNCAAEDWVAAETRRCRSCQSVRLLKENCIYAAEPAWERCMLQPARVVESAKPPEIKVLERRHRATGLCFFLLGFSLSLVWYFLTKLSFLHVGTAMYIPYYCIRESCIFVFWFDSRSCLEMALSLTRDFELPLFLNKKFI